MTLSTRICAAVVQELESTLHSSLTHYDQRVLAMLVKEGIVTRQDLIPIAEKKLCADGRHCYLSHIHSLKRGPYVIHPDHTFAPSAFAYALDHGVFTPKEESAVRFDHGDTKESFIAEYGARVLDRLLDSWLTPHEETLSQVPSLDATAACACEGCPV